MSIQNIIDKAQQISIDRRKIVGQTISRSQRIKTSERSTAQPWKFTVTPPAQLNWSNSRAFIEVIDFNDRANEYEISLSNTAGMNYITEYRGELTQGMLDTITVDSVGTSTFTLTDLPSIGATLTSRTYTMTAKSFNVLNSTTYNRALSSSRTDFLITNAELDAHYYSIRPGDTLSVATYIVSGQTISSVTRNYITINGVGYTRIVMSAVADVNSPIASVDGEEDVSVDSDFSTVLSTSTVVFAQGDIIQPVNSRYPYTVALPVLRGSDSTVTVQLHRPVLTSEGASIATHGLNVGIDCTWRVVVTGLPTYTLVPGKRVQYTGDFEMIERII